MSSPIHTASCVARGPQWADVELGPTTACGVHFPFTAWFGLMLLHESATLTVYRSPGVRWERSSAPPLAGELDAETCIDLSCEDLNHPERQAQTARFVRSVRYVSTRNWSPWICAPNARGHFETATQLRHPGPREATKLLQRKVDECPPGDEDAQFPFATLRVEATDPRWVQHLEVGMLWDVYGFDENDRHLI